MEFKAFTEELSAKRRTISDLIRFIKTRTDQNPNYTILLGAGASITSGIRSATELCNLWRNDLYLQLAGEEANPNSTAEEQREYLQRHFGNWYDYSREYSSLFEKRYDLQRQRRMFVETEVAGKTPSIGYAYLISLVEQNFFNTIFTTNFDDLLNEAFYGYCDLRPIVCAHDSSINSITITSKRPKVIKLHGDYLFDDLKSTSRETESLEQNMKSKFIEFAKDYGLIVAGYSGSDRSIMDVLSALLKNDEYFKGGIYWCIRKNSEVSEELRKLIWRERVYFVEINGFDELMADIHIQLGYQNELPAGLISTTRRPNNLAEKLLSNTNSFSTLNSTLLRAKEKLEKQSKRTALLDLISKSEFEGKNGTNLNPDLTDDELYLLAEIQNLIQSEEYQLAIDKARACLKKEIRTYFKAAILRQIIRAHRLQDDEKSAISVADELIQLQPQKVSNILLRASLIRNFENKLKTIEKAILLDPYSVDALFEKTRVLVRAPNRKRGAARIEAAQQIESITDAALELDPSWRNPCWLVKFDIQSDIHRGAKNPARDYQTVIVEKLVRQNPHLSIVFQLRQSLLSEDSTELEFDTFFKDLEKAEAGHSEDFTFRYIVPKLRAAKKYYPKNKSLLESILLSCTQNSDIHKHEEATRATAEVLRSALGDDLQAKELLETCLEHEFDSDVFNDLIEILCDLGQTDQAQAIFDKWTHQVPASIKLKTEIIINDKRNELEKSLEVLSLEQSITGILNIEHKIYLNLRLERWKTAEDLSRELLTECNYSTDAVAPIINLEFACKMQQKKVSKTRLEEIQSKTKDPDILAAIFALLDDKPNCLKQIKLAVKANKTFRFSAMEWPVFKEYRGDPTFVDAISI